MRAVLTLLTFAALSVGARPEPRPPGTPVDGVRIVEVLPSQAVVGEPQPVYVRVRYELRTRAEGELTLGFNSSSPQGFRVFAREPVSRGEGEAVLTAQVTPRDWGKLVFFQAFVALSEPRPAPPPRPQPGERPPPGPARRALATDHVPIPLVARKAD